MTIQEFINNVSDRIVDYLRDNRYYIYYESDTQRN